MIESSRADVPYCEDGEWAEWLIVAVPADRRLLISSRLLAGWAVEARKPYQARSQVSSSSDRTRQDGTGDATADGAGLLVSFLCMAAKRTWAVNPHPGRVVLSAKGKQNKMASALHLDCLCPPPPPPIRTDSGDPTTFTDGKSKSGEQVPGTHLPTWVI